MARRSPRRVRRPVRSRSLGRWFAVVTLVLVAALYYRPLTGYLERKDAVAAREAEVAELRQERTALARRLAAQTSEESLRREARRLGYVSPGETLYIVKGIPAWRFEHRGDRSDGGH
jgi:cell division protein FtsB